MGRAELLLMGARCNLLYRHVVFTDLAESELQRTHSTMNGLAYCAYCVTAICDGLAFRTVDSVGQLS